MVSEAGYPPSLFDLVRPLTDPVPARVLMRAYRANPLDTFPARAYEDERVVRPMFGRPSILTNRAGDIRHVLVDNHGNYGRTRAGVRILRPLLGNGLLIASGTAWQAQRRAIAPAFAPGAMPAFATATVEALVPAQRALRDALGAPVDLLGWLQMLTIDVAGRALFSLPLGGALGQAIRACIGGYGVRYGRPSLLDFALPACLPNPRDLGRLRVRRRLFALVDQLIAERRRLPPDPQRRDVFDRLAASPATHHDGPGGLRDQVATLIVAGHETTAITLFWALNLLAYHPGWQERLAEEAAGIDFTAAAAAGNAVAALPLARAVVDETMRLFPPVYLIVRQATGADRLDELPVEPGTVILISPWVVHRHRRLWQEPDRFSPERFRHRPGADRRYAWLPFGAGPRVCVGASLAVTEAAIVLSSVLREFLVEPDDPAPVRPIAAITTQPGYVPLFRVAPRATR